MGGMAGRSILIVEDEMLLAMDIEEMVRSAGCSVIGPVGTVAEAVRKLRDSKPDGAILDVSLSGELVFPIADALQEAGIPFMIVTGYARDQVPERHRTRPFLQKPYKATVLIDMLGRLLGSAGASPRSGSARPKSA
jgi:CheY-like chemotaxis protein